MNLTDYELEQSCPGIKWREPIRVERTDGLVRYACRFCIAHLGLKATELERQFVSEADAAAHIAMVHIKPEPRLPEQTCPSCGKRLDAATALERGGVRPGDVSICIYCGHLSILGEDNRLRPPTDAEMIEIAGDPRILRAQAARMATMREKMSDRHTYPQNYPHDHPSPFVRIGWALLDQIPPGVVPEQWRFLLGGLVAGALQEAYTIGAEGRSMEDMAKAHES